MTISDPKFPIYYTLGEIFIGNFLLPLGGLPPLRTFELGFVAHPQFAHA